MPCCTQGPQMVDGPGLALGYPRPVAQYGSPLCRIVVMDSGMTLAVCSDREK
jgi:hypothetical protein